MITAKPGKAFWTIAGAALLWNLLGLMAYYSTVTITPEALAELPEAERNLYTQLPVWVVSAFAVAVTAGVAGSIALLLRRSWSIGIFAVSLLAVIVQQVYTLFMTDYVAVMGATGLAIPVLTLVIAAFLVFYARSANERGLLQ